MATSFMSPSAGGVIAVVELLSFPITLAIKYTVAVAGSVSVPGASISGTGMPAMSRTISPKLLSS